VAWHRMVVGAGLLAFIGALAISISGRNGHPPHIIARMIALTAAVLVLVIAWRIYAGAVGPLQNAIQGAGWRWLVGGGGLLLGGAAGMFGLPKPPPPKKKRR